MKKGPMHVLMVSKALVVGGYHSKLEEMAGLGIHLDVVIPRIWGNQKAERVQANGYTIHALPVIFSGRNHFHFYPSLSALIKKLKPDMIHADEESFSFITFFIVRQARALGIPVVFFNWQNIYKTYPWPFSAWERFTMNNASSGIAGSAEVKDVLRKKGCSIPLFVIPQFGVDTNVFYKQPQAELKKSIAGNTKIILLGYIGRLVQEKGVGDLLQAMTLLPQKVHIVFIGSGDQKLELEKKARLLEFSERVHFVDHIRSSEMPRYINILDCLVLPSHTRSNWKEQFGRVLIEAMACEVPVIGSNSGEIPNVIGDAGYIFQEGDTVKLADTIRQLLSDEGKRKEMGAAGRVRVEQYFTQKKIACDTVHVYQSILDNRVDSL
jgi:glycosyltransferase involved in cell wall biosynthesis